MAREHYLQKAKKEQLAEIVAAVKYATKKTKDGAVLSGLLAECFEKLGLSPATTKRHLKELEDAGLVKIDEQNNKVMFIGDTART